MGIARSISEKEFTEQEKQLKILFEEEERKRLFAEEDQRRENVLNLSLIHISEPTRPY